MAKDNRITGVILVVFFGIILQLILGMADQSSTPGKTAVEFTKAYFSLDASMSEYICNELMEEENIVEKYINQVAQEAQLLGFKLSYMRSRLYHVKTEIVSQDESEAKIRITCERKRLINPVFTIVGKLFFIGETYEVDETLNIIKEDGVWKVCGKAFSLPV
ncbi:MAG: hypothetical protein SWH54_14510 [Thermodesulfobacteriota bacterium]|nr:hypothetical protein [Thermodesulfobacteriota bacterium]